ncbi:MAG: type I DNA topoisomerase [Victivallales bacterium]|nr:type I DNA topoisomerase [Victivallales bacterium]
MAKHPLMIVESITKSKTISKLLGPGITVKASIGHICDLPNGKDLGVDLAHDFKPNYVLTPQGQHVIRELRAEAKKADEIYLATDPDREGEAIAWHLQNYLRDYAKGPFHRISYHEITKNAIKNAFQHPGVVEQPLVDAQQARRILDRLLGYQVSPLLSHAVKNATSAGRVQSVALRLIVEREREIQAFQPVEYWNLDAIFSPQGSQDTKLKTHLTRLNGVKAEIPTGDIANALATALQSPGVSHRVARITSTPRVQRPYPPFITSTLQQAASSFLHYPPKRTMEIAQKLFEGVDLGGGNFVGLITYMRTDSVNVAQEAQNAARQFIGTTYGEQFVPATPNRYRSGKGAQEAHEAIRPTNVAYTPDSIANALTAEQLKLYRLIWNRFVASQMSPANQVDHAIEVESQGGALTTLALPKFKTPGVVATFRAAARETLFPGYLTVYNFKDIGQEDELDSLTGALPKLPENTLCSLLELKQEQCFTQPPSRYSEASLVKALESNGVGRPSTYANIVNTIQQRGYVEKQKGALVPTPVGFEANDYLVSKFPKLFDVGFTAQMENQLDEIEAGNENWVDMLHKFYDGYQTWLADAGAMPSVGSVDNQLIRQLLGLFPKDFAFDPPVKGARSTRDDARLVHDLQKQVTAGKKPLTDRQSAALIRMTAKYAMRDASLLAAAEKIGLGDFLRQQIEAYQSATQKQSETTTTGEPLSPAVEKLLEAMKSIVWEKPTATGRRKPFDAGRFFRSILHQAETAHTLTAKQIAAIGKLASRNSEQIPGYTELAKELNLTALESAEDDAVKNGKGQNAGTDLTQTCEELFRRVEAITEWKPAAKRGRRTYDDKAFVDSLHDQFLRKGSLSDKQVAALQKLLAHYEK